MLSIKSSLIKKLTQTFFLHLFLSQTFFQNCWPQLDDDYPFTFWVIRMYNEISNLIQPYGERDTRLFRMGWSLSTRQFKNKIRYCQYLRPHVLIHLFFFFFVSGKCHCVHSIIWFGMYAQVSNIFNVTSLPSTVWMYASNTSICLLLK